MDHGGMEIGIEILPLGKKEGKSKRVVNIIDRQRYAEVEENQRLICQANEQLQKPTTTILSMATIGWS